MKATLISAVCLLGALVTAGCDECGSYGQLRCRGDVLEECIDDGDGPFANFRWVVRGCEVTCHATEGKAGCVDSRQPIQQCEGATADKGVCFEGRPSGCWDGYLIKGQACGSTTHCVESAECGPICVAGSAPEPRCAQERFCDGGDAIALCKCGYVQYRFSCSTGLSCQDMRGQPVCLSAAPDPRCGDPTQQYFSFCEGNVLVGCWYGYLSSINDCAKISSPAGRCEPTATPTRKPSCVTSI